MMVPGQSVFESHPWATALFAVGFGVLVYIRETAKRNPVARAEYYRPTGRIVFWVCVAMMAAGAGIILVGSLKQ
jgi:hypothetical protein